MENGQPGICRKCRYAKDKFRDMCYCVKYGFIIGFTKNKCRGFEREQVREQKVGVGRENV